MTKISLIAAMDKNGVIGREGDLPWPRIQPDMDWFRRHTRGKPILMGRKTFDSIGRPLPDRLNIVMTRQNNWQAPDGVRVVKSLDEALDLPQLHDTPELMIIGGAQIYQLALPRADRLYLTRIQAEYGGDTAFPKYDNSMWYVAQKQDIQASDEVPAMQFQVLDHK